MKSRFRPLGFIRPQRVIILLLMRKGLFGLILLLVVTPACTRRPVQKDVVIDEPPGHSAERDLASSKGAAEAPTSLQFIDTMIRSNLSAIDAEQLVSTRAGNGELKKLARWRIAEQQREIANLRQLRSAWFGNSPTAENLELPGARDALQAVDAEKLDPLKETAFDLEFVRQMISHDEAVSVLARYIVNTTSRDELRQLAQAVASEKSDEISQMRAWKKE